MLSDKEFAVSFRRALIQVATDPKLDLAFGNGEREEIDPAAPRMSSIGDCARKQYFRLRATSPAPREADGLWAPLLGYAGQSLVAKVLEVMGYAVEHQDLTVKLGKLIGHIDGVLSGGDLGESTAVWDGKLRGATMYRRLNAQGLPKADATMYMQLQCYREALSADKCIITLVPFDFSTNRALMGQYKVDGDALITRIVLDEDEEASDIAQARALILGKAVEKGQMVAREFNPKNRQHAIFPCGFCQYRTVCEITGDKGVTIPGLPEKWNE